MKKLKSFSTIIILGALSGALPEYLPTSAWAITNGEIDSENRFPTVGAIVLIKPTTAFPNFPDWATAPSVICSGTLVHPRVMLSAGHCTDGILQAVAAGFLTLDDIRLSFSPNAFDPKSWLEASAVITHPDHQPHSDGLNTTRIDLGVIVFKRPFKKVEPAILPPAFLLDELWQTGQLRTGNHGSPLFRAGYGRTADGLKPDGLRRFTTSAFQTFTATHLQLSANELFGEGGAGGHDSGSAVWWPDMISGTLIPVAVTQERLAFDASDDLCTRADIRQSLDFLDAIFQTIQAGIL